jgi:hypothetical protein
MMNNKYLLIRIFLFFVLSCTSSIVKAQDQDEDNEYFNIQKTKKYAKVFKDKDIGFQNEKWYFGIEVGGRTPSYHLENNLNGLLQENLSGDAQLGGYIGYQHQNKWMAEVGLTKYSLGYGILVATSPVGRYYFQAKQLVVPIRYKKKIITIGKVQKQSGLFLGVGLINFMPVNSESLGGFNNRIAVLSRTGRDTILLKNQTSFSGKFNTMIEVSADLNIYVSKRIDISIFGRYQYGFTPVVESNFQYTFNSQPTVFFQANTFANSFNYGFCLKYNYAVKKNYDVKPK